MKKINMNIYNKPTDEQIKLVGKCLADKKERYFAVALSMGTFFFGIITIIALIFIYYDILFSFYPMALCFIGYYVGFCCFIAADRCCKEKELFECGDFLICCGHIIDIHGKHKWNQKVTVCFKDKATETYALICPVLKRNDKVYVALVNRQYAPWALPRVIVKS